MLNGTSLIIGAGEIGSSLHKVIGGEIRDKVDIVGGNFDVIHICYPHFEGFVESVKEYIDKYAPKVCVIHSTVPVGTTRKCGDKCVHSPVRGKHPDLEEGIRTFQKYIGANSENMANLAYEALTHVNTPKVIPCILKGFDGKMQSSEDTELAKIMSTTYYGWNIMFMKEMKKVCDKHGANFEFVYKKWNRSYNFGYNMLAQKYDAQFARPVLDYVEGKIGGHCVVQNCELEDNYLTNLLKEYADTI